MMSGCRSTHMSRPSVHILRRLCAIQQS